MILRVAMAVAVAVGSIACGAGGAEPSATASAPAAPPAASSPQATDVAPGIACTVLASGLLVRSTEATGTGTSHADACRDAAARARAQGATTIEQVDGVFVGWLVAPTDDRMPAGALEAEVACELVVAHDVGARATGAASGSSEAEAYAMARAQACTALGETDCGSAFRVHVTHHGASRSFGSAGPREVHDVTLTLGRVRLAEGRASSRASRAAACRDAYRAACGAEPCPAGSALDSLDGVVIAPEPG